MEGPIRPSQRELRYARPLFLPFGLTVRLRLIPPAELRVNPVQR
jgi:hypothetical protein